MVRIDVQSTLDPKGSYLVNRVSMTREEMLAAIAAKPTGDFNKKGEPILLSPLVSWIIPELYEEKDSALAMVPCESCGIVCRKCLSYCTCGKIICNGCYIAYNHQSGGKHELESVKHP